MNGGITVDTSTTAAAPQRETMPQQETVPQHYEEIEGTWKLLREEKNGRESPKEVMMDSRLTVISHRYSIRVGGETIRGVCRIDPGKRPKAIDIIDDDGRYVDQLRLGIYQVQDDEMKTCFALPEQQRPEAFTTKSGTGQIHHVWKLQAMPHD